VGWNVASGTAGRGTVAFLCAAVAVLGVRFAF
jgi:hypothetical protein